MSQHVVTLTLVLPMCQEPVVQFTFFQKFVKTRHNIEIMFANASKQIVRLTFVRAYVKIRRKIYFSCANVSKHIVTLTLLFGDMSTHDVKHTT